MILSETEARLADQVDKIVTSIVGEGNVFLQPGEDWDVDVTQEPPVLTYRVADAAILGEKTLAVIAHDLAHLLHTTHVSYDKPSLGWDTLGQDGLAKLLIYAIEDKRIELLFSERFPGAKSLFEERNQEQWSKKALKGFPSLPAKWRFLLNCSRILNGMEALGSEEDRVAIARAIPALSQSLGAETTQELASNLGPVYAELLAVVTAEERARQEAARRREAEAEAARQAAQQAQQAQDDARAAEQEQKDVLESITQEEEPDGTEPERESPGTPEPQYEVEVEDEIPVEAPSDLVPEDEDPDLEDDLQDPHPLDPDKESNQNPPSPVETATTQEEDDQTPAASGPDPIEEVLDVLSPETTQQLEDDTKEIDVENLIDPELSDSRVGGHDFRIESEDEDHAEYFEDTEDGGFSRHDGSSGDEDEEFLTDEELEAGADGGEDLEWSDPNTVDPSIQGSVQSVFDDEGNEIEPEEWDDEAYRAEVEAALGRDLDPPDVRTSSLMDEMVEDLKEDDEYASNPFIVEKAKEQDKMAKEARKVERAIERDYKSAIAELAKDLHITASGKENIEYIKQHIAKNDLRYEIARASLQPEIRTLRRYTIQVLKENRRDRYGGNYDRGRRIKKSKLHRVMTGDPRLFERKQEIQGRSYAFVLNVDQSGSMGGYNEGSKQILAFQSALIVCEAFEGIVDTSVIGFTTDWPMNLKNSDAGYYGGGRRHKAVATRLYKPMDRQLRHRRAALAELSQSYNSTPLGAGMVEAINQLDKSEAEVKCLINITDGMPNDWDLTRASSERAKKKGYLNHLLEIKHRNSFYRQDPYQRDYGERFRTTALDMWFDSRHEVHTAADIPQGVLKLLRAVVRRHTGVLV